MDSDQISYLLQLAKDHKWFVLIAVVVGLIVRLLKSDTKIPINVPSQYRKYVALGLALVGAVIEKYAVGGTTWTNALIDGIAAWVLAEWGHKVVIEDVRGGKELPVPGLIKPGASPGSGKPPSLPPVVGAMILTLGLMILPGCKLFQGKGTEQDTKQVLSVIQLACIAANAFLDNAVVMKSCNIADALAPQVLDLMSAQRKAAEVRPSMKPGAFLPAPVCVSGEQLIACAVVP